MYMHPDQVQQQSRNQTQLGIENSIDFAPPFE